MKKIKWLMYDTNRDKAVCRIVEGTPFPNGRKRLYHRVGRGKRGDYTPAMLFESSAVVVFRWLYYLKDRDTVAEKPCEVEYSDDGTVVSVRLLEPEDL